MRLFALCLVFATAAIGSAQDLETRLASLVKSADSEDPAVREAVQANLDAWCRDAGKRAAEMMEGAAKGAPPEVAARLKSQLEFLVECRKAREFLGAFDAFRLPAVGDLRFVAFNPGWHRMRDDLAVEFHFIQGWLIFETDAEIRLADLSLQVKTWSRKVELPRNWDKLKEKHPKGQPLPGSALVLDFAAYRNRIESGADKDPDDHFADMMRAQRGELPEATHFALLARWSFERREDRIGLRLLVHARALIEGSRDTRPGHKDLRTSERVMLDDLATSLRAKAIHAAQAGEPRAVLREAWSRLSSLPEHWASAEVAKKVAAYGRQLTEDESWKELSPEERAALAPADLAHYWLHRLRDVAAEQGGQPGHCSVFWLLKDKDANPAQELVNIGWDAVPLIIEHMEDDSPTRSVGYWRDFCPDTYHLLTYKDACQQIFEVIANVQIWDSRSTHDYPSFDRDPALLRKKAEACWKAARETGAEAACERLLDLDPDLAAEQLLKLNEKRWLPELKEKVLKGGPEAVTLLWSMYKLIQTDADYLRKVLNGPDLGAACWATDFLKSTHKSAEGVAVLLKRVAELPADPRPEDLRSLSRAMSEIAEERSLENAAAWRRFMDHPARAVRVLAAVRADGQPSREVVNALIPMLKDRSGADDVFEAYTGSKNIRVSDWAAYSLAKILDMPRDHYVLFDNDVEVKDATISRLNEWLEKNLATVNWEAVWAR